MQVSDYQYQALMFVDACFKRQFGNICKPELTYQDGWFEVVYPVNVARIPRIDVDIYLHMDFYCYNNGYQILGRFGFRSPYNKYKWERNSISESSLFRVGIDELYDKVDFVYKENSVMNERYPRIVQQFFADLHTNLDKSYLSLLCDIQ